MPLPLPPTPLDAERPHFPQFRKVRRNRNELKKRYQSKLKNLKREGTVSLIDELHDYDLGLLGQFVRWEHLRMKNCVRSKGLPQSDIHEYEIPASEIDDVRQAMQRMIWMLRLTNVINVVVQLLGLVVVIVVLLLLAGLI